MPMLRPSLIRTVTFSGDDPSDDEYIKIKEVQYTSIRDFTLIGIMRTSVNMSFVIK